MSKSVNDELYVSREMGKQLNHAENLLFVDFASFLEDYKMELESLEFEGEFLSFVMRQEMSYIQKLYASLAESYSRGIDTFMIMSLNRRARLSMCGI